MNRINRILSAVAVLSFGFLVAGAYAQGTMGKPNIVFNAQRMEP